MLISEAQPHENPSSPLFQPRNLDASELKFVPDTSLPTCISKGPLPRKATHIPQPWSLSPNSNSPPRGLNKALLSSSLNFASSSSLQNQNQTPLQTKSNQNRRYDKAPLGPVIRVNRGALASTSSSILTTDHHAVASPTHKEESIEVNVDSSNSVFALQKQKVDHATGSRHFVELRDYSFWQDRPAFYAPDSRNKSQSPCTALKNLHS